jgi:hypothetical protein
MGEKPAIKLFNWKKGIVIMMIGLAGITFRTYQSYQQKGHLDSFDFVAAGVTIAMIFSIVAIIGWCANR